VDVERFVAERWGSSKIITRARSHDVGALPGYLVREEGRLLGVITVSIEGPECEVVTIDAADEGRGIGSSMLERAEEHARAAGCDRMWLVTTNDNMRALGFYQLQGYRIMAVHRDAVVRSREQKPEIPVLGAHGIPIYDEIELEKAL
jgi:ribosomal protein S18 acetylase RimI-like enzyme